MDKQEIIEEIRRTAEENDGKTLGMHRFANVTGIRKSDWYGIHWASWSEVVVEAGFRPNELTKGYDETRLIESFIRIIREIEEWPTEGRLRLICRNDRELPNGNTFGSRLGNRAEIAKKILAYCQSREGNEDIIEICKPIIRVSETREDREEVVTEPFGFVYLMKSGKYYKIGHSNSVGRREYELGTKLPQKLETIHTIKTDDPEGIERYWHDRFEDTRKEGEWFELNAVDVKSFKKWRRIF